MQVKATVNYHFTPPRLKTIQKPNYTRIGKDTEHSLLYTANRNVTTTLVATGYHHLKLNLCTSYDPAPRNRYKSVHSITVVK